MRTNPFRKMLFLAGVFLVGLLITNQARADLITFAVSGTVTSASGTENLTGGVVQVGDTVSGTYTFTAPHPDSDASPDFGNYEYTMTPNGITLTSGDNVFSTDPNNVLFRIQPWDVYDSGTQTGSFDEYRVLSLNNDMPVAPGSSTSTLSTILVRVRGDNTTVGNTDERNLFDSDALPLLPPPLIDLNNLGLNTITIDLPVSTGSSTKVFTIEAVVDSLTLVPPTPEENIANLASAVMNLNLANGISNSLDSKLDTVLNALDDMNENNDAAACNSLSSFINAVEAQSGKQISESDAAALIADAMAIQDQLGCN